MAVKWEERKDPRDEVAWTSLGMSRQVNIHLDSTLEIIRSNFMFIRSLAKLPKEVLNIPLRHKPGYLLTAICRVSMVAMDGKRPDILFCLFFELSQESLAAFK